MFSKSSKNMGPCMGCRLTNIVLMVLAWIAVIASFIGLIAAHFAVQGGPVFGTMSGSLSLIALVISMFFLKKIGCCCSCQCALPSKK